jgi:Zn-dependent protease
MFSRGSLTLFRVRGVPIRAHWTLLLVIPYLAVALSKEFRSALPWGLALTVALFASVAVHELAHVALARRYGGRVHGVTLMLLGGVSHISRMPPRPRWEALMAAAGPATSIGLGLLLSVAYAFSGPLPQDWRTALFYVASMNLALGVFNLLPAFPMDGGRILRAWLAARWGAVRATRTAAQVGRGLAVAMALVGFFTGSLLLLLVALFVWIGAGAEHENVRTHAALEGLTVRDLLPPLSKAPQLDVDALLADALPRMRMYGRSELIVVDAVVEPLAVLSAADLAPVPPGARLGMRVRELLPKLQGRHVTIQASEPAVEALETASDAGAPFIVVVDRGHLALLTAHDVATAISLRLAERPAARPVAPVRTPQARPRPA